MLNVLVFHFQDRFHVFHAVFDELVEIFVKFDFRQEVANFTFILTLCSIVGVTLSRFAILGCLRSILSGNVIRNVLRYGADRRWKLLAYHAWSRILRPIAQGANKIFRLLALSLTGFARWT